MKANKRIKIINSILKFFIVSNAIEDIFDDKDAVITTRLFNQVKHANTQIAMYAVHKEMKHLNDYCTAGELRDYSVTVGLRKCLEHTKIKATLKKLFKNEPKSLKAILKWHIKFEKIHPFGDGNGRIGRFLMLMQSEKNNIELPELFFTLDDNFENDRQHYYALFK